MTDLNVLNERKPRINVNFYKEKVELGGKHDLALSREHGGPYHISYVPSYTGDVVFQRKPQNWTHIGMPMTFMDWRVILGCTQSKTNKELSMGEPFYQASREEGSSVNDCH